MLTVLAEHAGAKGGLLVAARQDGISWVTAPQTAPLYQRFVDEGWHTRNDRIPRLVARGHPGFLTDADFYSTAERASLPLYTDFLTPLGYDAAAATAVSGLAEDMVVLSMEGFASIEAAQGAVPMLDLLRPHLARAAMLASRFALERARAAVAALACLGAAAALVAPNGRLIAGNDLFGAGLGQFGTDTPQGLRLLDSAADRKYRASLEMLVRHGTGGVSLPVAAGDGRSRLVLHVLPMRGDARDIFSGAAAIVLLARPGAATVPDGRLIQELFDLTPAEAQLARHLAAGGTVATAAATSGVSAHTTRTHLKRVFAKTGLQRQSELVAMLGTIARPGR